MNKTNKTLTKVLFAVPILVGGYLIVRQLLRNKKANGKQDAPNDGGTGGGGTGGTGGGTSSLFPLKSGSNNSLVGSLQGLLNSAGASPALVVDNKFGAKTQAALKAIYGKTQIDNQADFDAFKATLSNKSLLTKNLAFGWGMQSAQAKGIYNYLVARNSITLTKYTKSFTGEWKPTSFTLTLVPHNYSLQDYSIDGVSTDGTVRIYCNKGANMGYWYTPVNIDLASYLDIQ